MENVKSFTPTETLIAALENIEGAQHAIVILVEADGAVSVTTSNVRQFEEIGMMHLAFDLLQERRI